MGTPLRTRQLQQARHLIHRLERLSADSLWARRASGIRAALLKAVARAESNLEEYQPDQNLESLVALGYQMLEKGAREMVTGKALRPRRKP
jgi:hypothetical protein